MTPRVRHTLMVECGEFDQSTGYWVVTGAQAKLLPPAATVIPFRYPDGTPTMNLVGPRLHSTPGVWVMAGGLSGALKEDWIYRVLWPAPFPAEGATVVPSHGGREVGA